VIPDPTLEDLVVGTPSVKILAKAEASQKRKASTFGATSSHVAKRTRSALAQSSGSTTRPSLFVGNSDDESDDDNDCGSSTAPGAEDSRGKGIVVDVAAAPPIGVSRPRPSSSPAPSFRCHSYGLLFLLLVLIMLPILKVVLLVIASLLARSGMLPIGLLLGLMRFLALGWLLEEIHVTWAHLEKTTTLHQILEEVVHTECGDGVVCFKRWRQDD
ncbi:hypothetical protein Tco_1565434, partial [Tanacetum coccineum]